MLNRKYRYVAMDFETTWLDLQKDEAIEIWLVEIDVEWNVINEFKSYIKPEKNITELKSLVAYITWISIKDIQSAPMINDLWDDISKFFWDNVILIGHNIEFDINFLKKYFPNVVYFDSIDTFYLAQNLVHFALSYALDVLVESLMMKDSFKSLFLKIHWSEYDGDKIHDALYDSKNALALFMYEMNRIDSIFYEYPILKNFLEKNNWLYHKILETQVDRAILKNEKIKLPSLKKQLPSDMSLKTDLQIDLQNYNNWERYFVWNVELSQLVKSLVSSNKWIIMAFSSLPKMNIVKNLLNDAWIKNIWFAKWYETIDQIKFSRFLNKDEFSDNEFLFVVKYLSHVMNGWSVLDLNTKMDYKIDYYIKDEKKFEKYPIVLSTHGGLYSILKNPEHKYRNYDICFFDLEMWYKWYNDYLSQPSDLYSILNFLETLFYKYSLDWLDDAKNVIERFVSFFEIFMWVLFSETKQFFVDTQDTILTINPIIGSVNFYETNKLFQQFLSYKDTLSECLDSLDFENLWYKINEFISICSWVIEVKKVMYNQSEFYFTYSEATKYTNWDEFKDIFVSNVYFLSNQEKSYPSLIDHPFTLDKLNTVKIPEMDSVVSFLQDELQKNTWKTYFILSTIKSESKELFDKIYASWLSESMPILVENITWSLWKNVFKAKSPSPKIIIWWYNFFMWLVSNKINIDICVNFNIIWKMSKYLLDDMERYAK